jgi:hypothetical protein
MNHDYVSSTIVQLWHLVAHAKVVSMTSACYDLSIQGSCAILIL